ncbi:hypothetical protein BH09PLA1_BH09PLA1_05410 [soil metagenome]
MMFRHRLIVAFISGWMCLPALAQTTSPATQPIKESPTEPVPKRGPKAEVFMQRHEENVARAKQGDVELLFLGDSITAGWPKAKEAWEKNYGQWKTANFGIGGDHTQHVLWRIMNGELDGIAPRVVVLLIGTNNTGTSQTPDAIADGVARIVQTIQTKSPDTRVLLLAVFPREKGTPEQCAKVEPINQRLAKLDNGKSVRYLDLHERFVDASGKIPAELMPDGLHPSAAGYRIWADSMLPLLVEMMGGK